MAAVVSLAISAGGCSGGTAGASPAPEPSTLAGYYAQRLDWQPCDNGFECARLVVPFDYARPDGRRFTLPVIKLPASDPSRRIGALVVNPGGPGGSGVQYALGARSEFPAAVLARFDIVGFDPRGVGGSEPALACMTGPQLDRYFATNAEPSDAAQLVAVLAQNKLFAAQCERNSAALLPYVGTQNAARDMDVLRAALGEPRLSFLGKSYGTFLGAWYAQLFPHRIRALVLDGAVDPDASSLDLDTTQAEGFQVAFGSFAAWCMASAACPLGHGGSASAVAKVQTLIDRASSAPLANYLGDGQVADGAMLLNGVAAALYSKSLWPDLSTALARAFAGDGTGLVELANFLYERNPNGSYSNLADADTAINCLDRPWPRSLAAWQSAASVAGQDAPLFGAAFVWNSLACAYWPVPSYPLPSIRASGAPPILVVGTLRDPATPYRWAQALAGDLSSGVLLGWDGDGHTAYGEGSTCVNTIVNNYLISLSVPRSGAVCRLLSDSADAARVHRAGPAAQGRTASRGRPPACRDRRPPRPNTSGTANIQCRQSPSPWLARAMRVRPSELRPSPTAARPSPPAPGPSAEPLGTASSGSPAVSAAPSSAADRPGSPPCRERGPTTAFPVVGVLVGEHRDLWVLADVPQQLQVRAGLRLLVDGRMNGVILDREGDNYDTRPALGVSGPQTDNWHSREPGLAFGRPRAEDIMIPAAGRSGRGAASGRLIGSPRGGAPP